MNWPIENILYGPWRKQQGEHDTERQAGVSDRTLVPEYAWLFAAIAGEIRNAEGWDEVIQPYGNRMVVIDKLLLINELIKAEQVLNLVQDDLNMLREIKYKLHDDAPDPRKMITWQWQAAIQLNEILLFLEAGKSR